MSPVIVRQPHGARWLELQAHEGARREAADGHELRLNGSEGLSQQRNSMVARLDRDGEMHLASPAAGVAVELHFDDPAVAGEPEFGVHGRHRFMVAISIIDA